MKRIIATLAVVVSLLSTGGVVRGELLRVTIENLQPVDGFYFSPVWLGFHDGGFDLYDTGSAASMEVESVAEVGNAGPLSTLFQSATNGDGSARFDVTMTSPGGFGPLPVFDPGEAPTIMIDVPDPATNRYLSYASMVVPSNDAFFGNDDPMQQMVFHADGSFAGPLVIEIRGGQVYDAGTEVNDGMGAAFSTLGGTDSDEGGTVAVHPGLGLFVGTMTADGTTIGSAIDASELVARITIAQVPEPATGALFVLGLLGIGLLTTRRRTH